jgi:hypothetical protein
VKAEQRRPWLELVASTYDPEKGDCRLWLCSFCRYAGRDNEIDDMGYVLYWFPTCEHPLDAVADPFNDGDREMTFCNSCWGFRPKKGATLEAERQRLGITAEQAVRAYDELEAKMHAYWEERAQQCAAFFGGRT